MTTSAVRRRITPNLLAISFGVAGLAQTWTIAGRLASAPAVISEFLWLVAGGVWLVTLCLYGRWVLAGSTLRRELADHTFGPFVAIGPIVGMLLAGGLEPHFRTSGLALYAVSLAAALALAGHLLAVWTLDDLPATQWHPGYFLPSVGAPFIAAAEAASFGYAGLARLLFGLGIVSWVLVGGILLHHLLGQQRLPTTLLPTMAILIAPPIVASNAWFAINGGRGDGVALGLAGYAVLMAIVQLGLIPTYRTVPFGPGWWSFSFPCAATTGNAIAWLAAEHVDSHHVLAYVLLATSTAFIGYLATRTARALVRRDFLPRATARAELATCGS